MHTLTDPAALWLRNPMADPCPDTLAWLEDRAVATLPDEPVAQSVPALIAVIRHAHAQTDETYAALAAAQVASDRTAADDVDRGATYRTAADGEWLAPDLSTLTLPPVPFPTTETHPRLATGRGIEVRGVRRSHKVVGGLTEPSGCEDGTYGTMWAVEALERADAWSRMTDPESHLPLLGTEDYSWSEMVTHRPYRYVLAGGAFILAPEGAGASIAGLGTSKRPPHRDRRASYSGTVVRLRHKDGERSTYVRPEAEYVGDILADVRVVKRYRTTLSQGRRTVTLPRDEVREDGRLTYRSPVVKCDTAKLPPLRFLGHRAERPTPKPTSGKGRRTDPPQIVTIDTLPEVLAALVAAGATNRPRVKVGAATITVRPDRGFDVSRPNQPRVRNVRNVTRVLQLAS